MTTFFFLLLTTLITLLSRCVSASPPLGAAQTTLSSRHGGNQITVTVFNKCDQRVQPVFQPSLPGHGLTAWPVLAAHNGYHAHTFASNTYRGFVYAPIQGSQQNGRLHTTHAELDVATGAYDVSLAYGFNVALAIQLQGKQDASGQCTTAYCEDAACADAYTTESGLLTGNRTGSPFVPPNHFCPPDFTNWVVFLC